MLDGKDCARKRHSGDGASNDEDWLERKSRDVADEGDFWIDLAGISGSANCQPPDEQDTECCEPGDTCYQWENPELVRVTEVSEDFEPRAGHVV